MKRLSLLTTLLAAALAICAFASASASATVLCNWAPASHECGPSGTYPIGTEINASLTPGSEARFFTQEGTLLVKCAESKFRIKSIKNSAGAIVFQTQAYSFGSCTSGGAPSLVQVTEPGEMQVTWRNGTHNGEIFGRNSMILDTAFFGKCGVWLLGAENSEVVGGASPTVVYNGGRVYRNSGFCPSVMRFNAQYTISSPNPLYVENN